MQKSTFLTAFLPFLPLALAHPLASIPSLAPRTPPLLNCPTSPVFTYISLKYQTTKIFLTPSHLASAQEEIAFDLANSATSYSLHCAASASLLPDGTTSFDGSQGYWCSDLSDESVNKENFQFDARGLVGSEGTGKITMVPSWSCLEGGVSKQWMGLGNKDLTFQCKREYWQNPTWQLGETFSSDVTSCASETLSFAPPVVPAWGGNGGK